MEIFVITTLITLAFARLIYLDRKVLKQMKEWKAIAEANKKNDDVTPDAL